MTVLLTRPEADSREVAAELAALGLDSLIWPLTRIEQAEGPIAVPEDADGLLFTSANAVRAFAAGHAGRALPALCVGARTARVARELGFADARSADGDAAALARLSAASGLGRLFHPRGRDSAVDLAALLAPEGIAVTDLAVYAAEPAGPPPPPVAAALAKGEVRVLTLWSPRNAEILRRLWQATPPADPAPIAVAAISPAAAQPLDGLGFGTILVADRPDRPAMLRTIRLADAALRR